MTEAERTVMLEQALLMHMPLNGGTNVAAQEAAKAALGLEGILSMDRLIAFAEARGHDPNELWPRIMRVRATPEAQALSRRRC